MLFDHIGLMYCDEISSDLALQILVLESRKNQHDF